MTIQELLLREEENRIGNINGMIVSVFHEPILNPSFHIRNKTFTKHSAYQIKDWKLLEQKGKTFSNKELKEVNSWFKEKSIEFPKLTNWELLIGSWNLQNESNKLSLETKQPTLKT